MRLRLASSLLLLSVPFAVLQAILASGAPLWNLPRDRIGFVALLALALFLPLVHWLNSGKIWALWLTAITALSWFLVSMFSAFHLVSFWMAIFVTFLGAYWLVTCLWLRAELQKSYFDPQMKWYHGAPEAIAGLSAEIVEGGPLGEFRVCRFDRDGAFVFRSSAQSEEKAELRRPPKRLAVAFRYRGREVLVNGAVIKVIGQGDGFGFRFAAPSPDLQKDLGDFIERLKGEGYV